MNCPYSKYKDAGFFNSCYICDSPSNKGNEVSNTSICGSTKYENCPYYVNVNKQQSVSVHASRTVRVKCPHCGKELIVTID